MVPLNVLQVNEVSSKDIKIHEIFNVMDRQVKSFVISIWTAWTPLIVSITDASHIIAFPARQLECQNKL